MQRFRVRTMGEEGPGRVRRLQMNTRGYGGSVDFKEGRDTCTSSQSRYLNGVSAC